LTRKTPVKKPASLFIQPIRKILAYALTAALASPAAGADLPALLSDTGLFAPGQVGTIAVAVLPFSPQYPLWSDGATKRRWISLPPGLSIDATRPDEVEPQGRPRRGRRQRRKRLGYRPAANLK
jgi:hypothetical protein